MSFSLIAPPPRYPLPSVSQISSFLREFSPPESQGQSTFRKPHLKQYKCIYAGCHKAYSKPSKLADHERLHTGERPFKCSLCEKTYRKDQHLTVHMRTHLAFEDRPFLCQGEDCGKRFWTRTHLKIHFKSQHEDVGEDEGGEDDERTYQCPHCPQVFRKHKLLNAHVHLAHQSTSSRSFPCPHNSCDRTFPTASKLRSHQRSHDIHRYICTHPTCLSASNTVRFGKWSELQRHTKEVHPPRCRYEECRDKTFQSRRNLKNHLKTQHGERGSASETESRKRKRQDDTEEAEQSSKLTFQCKQEECNALAFKHNRALTLHIQRVHPNLLSFKCSHDACNYGALSQLVLNKHIQRHHPSDPEQTTANLIYTSNDQIAQDGETLIEPVLYRSNLVKRPKKVKPTAIDLLTGRGYEKHKRYGCPYHVIVGTLREEERTEEEKDGVEECLWRFENVRSVRRHLNSVHGLDIEAEELTRLIRQEEQLWDHDQLIPWTPGM